MIIWINFDFFLLEFLISWVLHLSSLCPFLSNWSIKGTISKTEPKSIWPVWGNTNSSSRIYKSFYKHMVLQLLHYKFVPPLQLKSLNPWNKTFMSAPDSNPLFLNDHQPERWPHPFHNVRSCASLTHKRANSATEPAIKLSALQTQKTTTKYLGRGRN